MGAINGEVQQISPSLQLLCQRYQALAVSADQNTLTVASAVELPEELFSALRFASGLKIVTVRWPTAQLEQALEASRTTKSSLPTQGADNASHEPMDSLSEESETPVVQFINQTLKLAIQRRASDIHFEPYQHSYRVRLRIDGVLQEVTPPPPGLANRVSARLKIMGKLNVAERRLPQDGQLSLLLEKQSYSMRISSLPTTYGEKIVLRILQSTQQSLDIGQLGFSAIAVNRYLQALDSPQGLILVTGPTGSGKTITLYSGLKYLNCIQRNICSVEDPVEIPVPGINQTQINTKAELSFARVLRALLRQDPDVIMVGEIRDAETAEIAVKAAQTGHLVLSTLHTNSTAETLIRLNQMGIAGYLIASCLRLVIAQRLVRRLCQHCREQTEESILIDPQLWPAPFRPWKAIGCSHCFSGYYGRTGLYEMLIVDAEIQQALVAGASSTELNTIARQQGQQSLLTAGLALAELGITSLEEVYRVVGSQLE